jgi:hypothetical protein
MGQGMTRVCIVTFGRESLSGADITCNEMDLPGLIRGRMVVVIIVYCYETESVTW